MSHKDSIISFQIKLKFLLFMAAFAASQVLCGQVDTVSGHWKEVEMNDKSAYILSNAYGVPSSTVMKVFADKDDINNWGGSIAIEGSPPEGSFWGAGVGQIVVGVWPWSKGRNTTNSGMPFIIADGKNYISDWSYEFTKENTLYSWAMYYEIWLHSDSNVNGDNITVDVMIQPSYDKNKGVYEGSLIDNTGAKWNAWVNYATRYEIIHFNRDEQTSDIKDVDLKVFWDYTIEKGWASEFDYVGSITAGLEAFNSGSAEFRTSKWSLVAEEGTPSDLDKNGNNPEIMIYPNPASNTIAIKGINNFQFHLYDSFGRLLLEGGNMLSNQKIDVSALPNGLYHVKIHTEKSTCSKEIVILK